MSNVTTTPTPTPQLEYIHRAAWKAGFVGAINAATVILAVRLTLLVAVCGGIALTYLALGSADTLRLYGLAIYAGMVVVPLVWLTARQ